ncbi:MAG: hypothetical protein HYW49_07970 [Deltaproteobacteria bacterium]|nr:hypothetical protein [Deltaproteobacteria bacterium]
MRNRKLRIHLARHLVLLAVFVPGAASANIPRLATFGTQPVFMSALGALPSAVATNAVNGSLWLDDDYNVFYNPAYVNGYRDYAILQKGFEGGAFKRVGELMVAGVYFNRGGAGRGFLSQTGVYSSGAQRQYAPGLIAPGVREIGGPGGVNAYTGGTPGAAGETHLPLDLFLGSDYSAKWGVHLATAQSPILKQGNEKNARYWHADLGAQFLGFEPFVGMTFASRVAYSNPGLGPSQGVQNLDEYDAGMRFRYEGWSPYLVFHRFVVSGTPMAAARQIKTRMHVFGLGLGRDFELTPGLRLYQHLGFFMNSVQDGDTALSTRVFPEIYRDYTQYTIPLNLGLENQCNEWVTLRAGLSYQVINAADYDSSKPDARTARANLRRIPEIRAGGSARWNEYAVDVVAGNGFATSNGPAFDENGGFEAGFFATASLTYRFPQY